jgi:hypothetical protein
MRTTLRAIRLLDAREAEIENLQPPGGGAHDVLRLEIPVDDTRGVRRRERFGELQRVRATSAAGVVRPPGSRRAASGRR